MEIRENPTNSLVTEQTDSGGLHISHSFLRPTECLTSIKKNCGGKWQVFLLRSVKDINASGGNKVGVPNIKPGGSWSYGVHLPSRGKKINNYYL